MPFPATVDAIVDGTSLGHVSQVLGPQRITVGPTMFNVKSDQYGAAGDGVTDDAGAITAALNACSAVGGGVVYVPQANYRINSRLIVPFNVTLQGTGRNAAYITALGTFPTGTELIRLGDLSGNIGVGCCVRNLAVDCFNVGTSTGLYSERINENSGVFNCMVRNYGNFGVRINQPGAGATPQNWSIDDVEIFSGTATGAAAIGLAVTMSTLSVMMRKISKVTVFATGSTQLTDAIKLDGLVGGHIEDIHVENAVNGIHVGAVLNCPGLIIQGFAGQGNVTTCVRLDANAGDSIMVAGVVPNGATNAIVDVPNAITVATFQTGLYVSGTGGAGSSVVLTTDFQTPNRFRSVQILKDLRRSSQTPTEAVLVSGVDATAGEHVSVTLTAARLVGAPLNPANGQHLYFTFIEGGAGAFAVTWNAVFKGLTWSNAGNVTGARSTIGFRYDGTNWNPLGAQALYA
jgi:hypothetical protein